jgi:hypothetical protein
MLSVVLCGIALALALIHHYRSKQRHFASLFLEYILLLNVGLYSLISAAGHLFMGPQIAKEIGWAAGSPFQFEIGIANLSYGVLGVLAWFKKEGFLQAAVCGWSVFLLGAFVGHMIQRVSIGDTAPYNFGLFVWFNDLTLPLLVLGLLYLYTKKTKRS